METREVQIHKNDHFLRRSEQCSEPWEQGDAARKTSITQTLRWRGGGEERSLCLGTPTSLPKGRIRPGGGLVGHAASSSGPQMADI